MGLELCRVVLVEPQIAANIGSVARVMHNMGLTELVLVNPQADPHERSAQQLSTHGEHLLEMARTVSDMGEALNDCIVTAGTSARTGGLFRRQNVGAPDEIIPHLTHAIHAGQRTALIFGPERTGLTDEQVSRCHYLINIPTSDIYPALNLAQAVAICLYELRRSWLKTAAALEENPEESLHAPHEMQERMLGQLQSALERIHFLYGPKSQPLMHALRHMLTKAQLTEMEVKILLGLARQIHWFADHSSPQPIHASPEKTG